MIIDGFQKLSLLDYPGYVSCIIFTRGCNFRCPYCQNSSLIPITKEVGMVSVDEVLAYLKKRKGVLDGIVVSGGEPLLQKDIAFFLSQVKDLGYLVKLDTNGSHPELLSRLLADGLVDYVAMDVKHVLDKYDVAGGKKVDLNRIEMSMDVIRKSGIDYEFRTTIAKELHSFDDICKIASLVGKESKFYLQNFVASEYVLDQSLHGFSKKELDEIRDKLVEGYPLVQIRG